MNLFSELERSGDKAVKVETENPLNTSHKCYKKVKFSLSKPRRHIESGGAAPLIPNLCTRQR